MNMEKKKSKILAMLDDDDYRPMRPDDIMLFMEVPKEDRQFFIECINSLVKEGKAVITKKGKVASLTSMQIISGKFIGNERGFGFVERDNNAEKLPDIFIPASKVNGAIHKDTVWCRITGKTDRRPEGEILRIISHCDNTIVGTFYNSRNHGFVVPDNSKYSDIYIPKSQKKGAVDGHKVIVKITKTDSGKNPEGRVTEILGHINDPGIDILSIVREYDLPVEFSDEALEQAEKCPDTYVPKENSERRDLRELSLITIDGEDAKDLDDAVYVQELENENYRLIVAIADVCEYVTESSPLDKDAYNRGTSVYLTDRVIPMLPHKLSNGICSLNAGEDRAALCCEMEFDKKGKNVSHSIFEAIINVKKRCAYNPVNDVLTIGIQTHPDYLEIFPMLEKMKELRDILLKKRIKRGAIEFDFPEAKIELDKNGKAINIIPRERNTATSIIEEFMLAANETIAQYFYWLEAPFIYRSHEEPDKERITKLNNFINNMGYFLKGNSNHPKTFQSLLEKTKNTPEDMLINKMVLRSLKKACYTAENMGHFGLAAKYYCHFTSPIRRYPDLQIHRIIKAYIHGKLKEPYVSFLKNKMADVAKQCSVTERRAEEAERETDNLKKAEYMLDKIGQTFEGIISGVTNYGFYVQLENTVEGLVRLSALPGDYYFYDEEEMCCRGKATGKIYTLGDYVKVKVYDVDMQNKNIDFDVVCE